MSKTLQIRLLGGSEIRLGDGPALSFASRRAEVLVAYLAVNGHAHGREAIATLLWDDRSQQQSLANLRSLLAQLPAEIKPFFTVTRQTISLETAGVWLDTAEFEAHINNAQSQWPSDTAVSLLESAMGLYRGDFLTGVYTRESQGLEEWTSAMQERLRRLAIDGRYRLATHYLHWRTYDKAIQHATAALQMDLLRESGHRLLMRLLVRAGQKNAALVQYERCRQILEEELGVEPARETTALYEQIFQTRAQLPHEVPLQPTLFVGREAELAHISEMFDNPDCRLLTILGLGGAGKSRLAIEAANNWRGEYLHGIYFVPLTAVESGDVLVTTLLEALKVPQQGKEPAQEQLLNFLRARELLLILDNFEQIMTAGSALVQTILEYAPGVKLLVTSRERLQLRAEWLVQVEGLSFPQIENGNDPLATAAYESVQLFDACARRAQQAFTLTVETAISVTHICRLVEGLPLALEMAAASLIHYPVERVATEIQRNLDILAVEMRDMPDRHRSIRAAFEYSWSLLSTDEQSVFQQLAVFRGGFTSEAATAVLLDANPTYLASFVTKSLVRQNSDGRYELHPLLWQYASEKLAASPLLENRVREKHTRHYAHFLHSLLEDLRGANVMAATALIGQEIENVRQAWQEAVRQQREAAISQAVDSLYVFYATRCWYEEGDAMLSQAADMLAALPRTTERQILTARIWARQGKLHETTRLSAKAESLYRQSLSIFREKGAEKEMGLPLQGLGYLAYMQGNNSEARQYLQESIVAFEKANSLSGTAAALNTLALVARRQGEFQEAKAACQRGLQIREQIGDRRGLAASLNILGLIECELGELHEAIESLQQSVAICRELDHPIGLSNALANLCNAAFQLGDLETAWCYAQDGLAVYRELDDRWGVAISFNNLGYVAQERGEYQPAQGLYRDSVAVYREVGVKSGLATALGNLGDVCVQLGQLEAAEGHLLEALQLATTSQDAPNTLLALGGMAGLLVANGRMEQGVALLLFVQDQPKANPWVHKRVAARLAHLLPQLPVEKQTVVKAESKRLLLENVVSEFLTT